jgi:hypothetical protein
MIAGSLAKNWSEEAISEINAEGKPIRLPDAVSLMSLADAKPDMAKTLLGNRFLCIGGGLLFVGPSGIGKSSASVQQDILWALGRPAFGIYPARRLRLLCIQAENDDGDLGEMARGVCEGLHLSNGDRNAIRDHVLYVSERAHTGLVFLKAVVAPLLEKHRPDILRLDPLLAYLGDDVNDQRSTAAFLRTGLNPLLEQFNCAAIINHHTPKVFNRDTSGWRASDWMYSGAGSADVTNWCRAALVIDPTYAPHVFRFIAAKRGGRVDWRDEDDGSTIYERTFCHQRTGGLCWHKATAADLAEVESNKQKRKQKAPSKTKEDLMALVPSEGAISKNMLMGRAQANGIGEKRTRGFLSELIESRDLHEWRVPRPRTNPEIRIARKEQPPV